MDKGMMSMAQTTIGNIATASATVGVGWGTVLGWLNPILGTIATLGGIALTYTLFYKNVLSIQEHKRNAKTAEEKRKEVKCRKQDGLPCDRHDDDVEGGD